MTCCRPCLGLLKHGEELGAAGCDNRLKASRVGHLELCLGPWGLPSPSNLNFGTPITGSLRTNRIVLLLYHCIIAIWCSRSSPSTILALARAPALLSKVEAGGWAGAWAGAGVGP